MNRQQFAALIVTLFTGVDEQPPAVRQEVEGVPSAMDVWFGCLNDLTIDQMRIAVGRFLKEGRGRPTIQKLRELAGVNTKAESAWYVVRRSISSWSGHDITFDPVTNATVRHLGGWPNICNQTSENLDYMRTSFCREWDKHFARLDQLTEAETKPLRCELETCQQPAAVDTGIGLGVVAARPRLNADPKGSDPDAGQNRPFGIGEIIGSRDDG